MMMNQSTRTLLLFAFLQFANPLGRVDGTEIDFENDIGPILENNCWYCHGEDEQESGLRLDRRLSMLKGGDSGLATVVPGYPEKSYLLDVINHVDEDMAMPSDEDKLDDADIQLIEQWIKQGAVWPGQMDELVQQKSDHWSFQTIVRSEVPSIDSTKTIANPIDAFLLDRLAQDDLTYSDPADPRSLIRRAAIVLTCIAPTADQTQQFVSDYSDSPDTAYAALIDRLMSSPHFGERWAQHWLDVIRWAETNGSESNAYRKNAWIYRDYVIGVFNDDKPYDQFLQEQIAGDTMGQGDATGYLVSGPHVPLATVGKEPVAQRQARADRMDEILQTVGASALGVTICFARCHNHKFDPISINDYYSMSAVFQDIEFSGRYPELGDDHPRAVRGRELTEEIVRQRHKLRKYGAWEEDWTGYKEIFFTETTAHAIRFTFGGQYTRIDELEIFGPVDWRVNLAAASQNVQLRASEKNKPGFPAQRINDGQFGNEAWAASPGSDDSDRPWVSFTFDQPQKINRFRISTNREDFLETDYLQGLKTFSFQPYVVEVQTEAGGTWETVLDSRKLQKSVQQNEPQQAILDEIHRVIELRGEEGPKPSFVGRFIEPAKTFVFGRGSPENPRDEVFASGLSEIDGDLGIDADADGAERRKAFADWVASPDNPLTARVAANRLWHHVFGRGIVTTTSDFGAAGAPPTHPELLEWLAAELMEPKFQPGLGEPNPSETQPWSMKHLIRLMVMSDAFRQSSRPNDDAIKIDGDSALLWRFPPKRVEAEVIRDSVLQASGLLDRTIGGRSYRIHNVKKRYAQWEIIDNYSKETWRRMIYQERMRRVDDQMFTAFDFPECGQVRAKRPVSTTPLQALNLMNSDFVIDQSKRIAQRARDDADGDPANSFNRCFELLLGRQPDQEEQTACVEIADDIGLKFVCRALINSNEFAFLP